MKRAVIVHGWGGDPQEGWFPWLKKELEGRGYAVEVPEMPDTMRPTIDAWVSKLREVVGQPDEGLLLVGHSIGCQTVLRYLATVHSSAGAAVLVAPWVGLVGLGDDEEWAIAKPWLETPIDFAAAKAHAQQFLLIFSDNDEFVPLENEEQLTEALDATSIVLHDKGHINGEAGVTELPEIFTFVK